MSIYLVPLCNLESLQAKAAKFARKAAKLGVVGPEIVIGEHVASMRDEIDPAYIHRLFEVTVSGSVPRVATGHEFIAKLHHMGDTAIVMQPNGAPVMPEHYRVRGSRCDHCSTRRPRHDTFVLRAENGEHVQVGRSCLADFMPARDAEAIVAMAAWLKDAADACEDHGSPVARGKGEIELEYCLAAVCRVIEVDGYFVSRKMASERDCSPTSSKAGALRFADPKTEDGAVLIATYGRDWRKEDSTASVAARSAIAWAAGLSDFDCESEYMSNIRALARLGLCDNATMGLAASIPTAYTRAMGQLVERAKREEKQVKHIGTVGARGTFVLTVHKVIPSEGTYGWTYFHIMSDQDGNAVAWRASGTNFTEGETLTVKATVKEHGEYKGKPQTVLTRCSAVVAQSIAA